MAFQTRVDMGDLSPGLARKRVRAAQEYRNAMPPEGSRVEDIAAQRRSIVGMNRARTVAAAAEASRNMYNVDPAKRAAMQAEHSAWWAEQMAMQNRRAKTPTPPKRKTKGRKGKGKGKKGKKAGGGMTQKRKSFFSLF